MVRNRRFKLVLVPVVDVRLVRMRYHYLYLIKSANPNDPITVDCRRLELTGHRYCISSVGLDQFKHNCIEMVHQRGYRQKLKRAEN